MAERAGVVDGSGLIPRTIQVGFVAAVIALWFFLTLGGHVHLLLLPDPVKVWYAMIQLAVSGQLWAAAKVTLLSIVKAYFTAVIPGLIIGFLVSRSQRSVRFFEPIFSGIFSVPLTLFFPLFIFFFGIGPNSKIAYGGLYAFFPVVITSIAAFASTDRLYIKAAQSMGANQLQLFRRVYFPSALPGILTGLRIAVVICVASVLGGETISSTNGVGHAIALQAELMETARMYAWVVYVVVAVVALNMALSAIEAGTERR
jgi:ABC-type nitrate/sulfonate/bicarbonate transport system permease component